MDQVDSVLAAAAGGLCSQYFIGSSNHRSVLLNTLIPHRSNYLFKAQINAATSTTLSDAGTGILWIILCNFLNLFIFFFFKNCKRAN